MFETKSRVILIYLQGLQICSSVTSQFSLYMLHRRKRFLQWPLRLRVSGWILRMRRKGGI